MKRDQSALNILARKAHIDHSQEEGILSHNIHLPPQKYMDADLTPIADSAS